MTSGQVTQHALEAWVLGSPSGLVTQHALEAWVSGAPLGLITQHGFEVWVTNTSGASGSTQGVLTQHALEVWLSTAQATPPTPPPPSASIRAQTQALWSNGVFIPAWMDGAGFFTSGSVTGLTSTPFASGDKFGFPEAFTDSSSGIWLARFSGEVHHYTSAGVISNYAPPSGASLYQGLAVNASGVPFMVDSSSNIYIVSAGAQTKVGQFASSPAGELAFALGSMYVLLPTVTGVGSIDPSAHTTGVVSVPNTTQIDCLGGSSSLLAVGGWNYANIPSGFSALTASPISTGTFAAASTAASAVSLWTRDAHNNWTLSQIVTGVGAPSSIAWSPNGINILTGDSINNQINVFNFVFGALTLAQTIAVTGVSAIALTLDSLHGLAVQNSLNQVQPLTVSGSGWAVSGAPLSIASAKGVLINSNTNAFVGSSSGISTVTLTASGWTVTSNASVPFIPNAFAVDYLGDLFACGTSGSSGYVVAGGVTGTFAGSADWMLSVQGQAVIADDTNNLLRTFQFFNGNLTQKSQTPAIASGIGPLTYVSPEVLSAGSAKASQFMFSGPFNVKPEQTGEVSLYNGSSWTSVSTKVGVVPEAIALSGTTVSVAMLNNTLVQYDFSGNVLATSGIAQVSGNPASVPVGSASLLWFNGHLYATSTLNERFIEVQ